jgi:hypothetical protein
MNGYFNLERLDTSDGGTEIPSTYAQYGIKSDVLFAGPYNSGGVSALNRSSWARNAVSYFQDYCGGSASECPAIEVLNEPWGSWFWGSNSQSSQNEAAYGLLVQATYNAFHTQYGSNSPAILAAYASDSWWNGVKSGVPNINSYLDGITVHPYGGTSSSSASAEGNHAQVTAAYNATHKPVWVTEIGWPTDCSGSCPSSSNATGDSLQWSETEQAANIYNFVTWAQSTGYVVAITYFNYRDYQPNNWYGVERSSGDGSGVVDRSKKPGWTALYQAFQHQRCTVCS